MATQIDPIKRPGCAPDSCPHCHASLIDGPIPEEFLKYYDGRTHYTRVIGLRLTDEWQCPDCGKRWER